MDTQEDDFYLREHYSKQAEERNYPVIFMATVFNYCCNSSKWNRGRKEKKKEREKKKKI